MPMNIFKKASVIWNEDILHWIEDWYFWKFTYPKVYKDKRCVICGGLIDFDFHNDENHCNCF